MEIKMNFCLASLICLLILHGAFGEYSTEDCSAFGFSRSNLLCTVCDQLEDFKLGLLKDSCKGCCNQESGSAQTRKKYAKARLEVCTCKFGAYPQVQAFIKSERPSNFPNLSIRYVRGLDPIIKLMDQDSNVVETLAIDKWNTDSIEEFLTTHLESPADDLNLDYLKTNMI